MNFSFTGKPEEGSVVVLASQSKIACVYDNANKCWTTEQKHDREGRPLFNASIGIYSPEDPDAKPMSALVELLHPVEGITVPNQVYLVDGVISVYTKKDGSAGISFKATKIVATNPSSGPPSSKPAAPAA